MEKILNFAILCPGPSLKEHSRFEYDQDCLIAVNTAILRCVPNYWSVLDPHVFATVAERTYFPDYYPLMTQIWTFENFMNFGLYNLDGGSPVWNDEIRDYFKKFTCLLYSELRQSMPFGKCIEWREYSSFAAIALAVLNGAKVIRVYGADMAGDGYFAAGLKNVKTRLTENRWNYEKKYFEEITRVCAENGIIVERVMP